jgi:hypothetical protein
MVAFATDGLRRAADVARLLHALDPRFEAGD